MLNLKASPAEVITGLVYCSNEIMKTLYKWMMIASSLLAVNAVNLPFVSDAVTSSNAGTKPVNKQAIIKRASGTLTVGYPLVNGAWVDRLFVGDPTNVANIFSINEDSYKGLLSIKDTDGNSYVLFMGSNESTAGYYDGFAIEQYGDGGLIDNLIDTSGLKVWTQGSNKRVIFGSQVNDTEFTNYNVFLYFKKPVMIASFEDKMINYASVFADNSISFISSYQGFIPGCSYNSFAVKIGNIETILNQSALYNFKTFTNNFNFIYTDINNGIQSRNLLNFTSGESIRAYRYTSTHEQSTNTEYRYKDGIGFFDASGNFENRDIFYATSGWYGTVGASIPIATTNVFVNSHNYYDLSSPYTSSTLFTVGTYNDPYNYLATTGANIEEQLKMFANNYGYPSGYNDGQNNPTFKSFIVSSMEACQAFFDLPIMGDRITVGVLIGGFIGLGALFLIIKLFR